MDAVFQPGIRTSFSPPTFKELEFSSFFGNSVLFDEEPDKENYPPLPTTPESARPTRRPVLIRIGPLEEEFRLFLEKLTKSCLNNFYCYFCCVCTVIATKINVFDFIKTFF